MTPLARIFGVVGTEPPDALCAWDERVSEWLKQYQRGTGASELVEIVLAGAVFVFDCVQERVVLAYAVSTLQLMARDGSRIQGLPDVNVGVRKALGPDAKLYDRGHFLGHASGGELDINLFPHERALNRGWSDHGKAFRKLERDAAARTGTFFFHRPEYADDTWIPTVLEFGVLLGGTTWAQGTFLNR
ncbi:MAG: DNA/RNA non-specific endonuclease [Gemmatimonadaceae bacterium]